MNKKETLVEALKAREDEVLHYQINIDNYKRAIVAADKDPELTDFSSQLRELLASSILEQKKAIIMQNVIAEQLKEMT